MKVLLLAPTYQDLYKPIIAEMERRGHSVVFIEDISLPHCPFYKNQNRFKKTLCKAFFFWGKIPEKYWKRKIARTPLLNQSYDVLFCINGISFHSILLKHLQKYNPNIRTSLYLWDTCKFVDFLYQTRRYFDKIYTFDYNDSVEQQIHFLPFYWVPIKKRKNEIKYSLSIVGTDHDGRYEIVQKVAKQLRVLKLPFCFRIVVNPNKIHKYQDKDIITTTKLSLQETQSIMLASECVLDTDRESQTGTTPRLIWATAIGKKIITTNTNIKKIPFYNPGRIQIIDRTDPIIDIDFIKKPLQIEFKDSEYIKKLCITEWVSNFL